MTYIHTDNTLVFLAQKDALIFFDAKTAGEIQIMTSRPIAVETTDSGGNKTGYGCNIKIEKAGVYRVLLKSDKLGECDIGIEHTEGITPFIMPGAGVLWNHGGIFPLLLKKEQPHVLYTINDQTFPDKVVCIKGIDYGEMADISDEDGSIGLKWYPKLGRAWFWHSAEFISDSRYFTIKIKAGRSDVRYTAWNAFITSLEKPVSAFQTGRIRLAAYDGSGAEIDARYEFYAGSGSKGDEGGGSSEGCISKGVEGGKIDRGSSGGERVAMYDVMAGEQPEVMLPVGRYTLKISHGVCFDTFETTVEIAGEQITAITPVLKRLIELPKGWALGELHTHSAFEDATMFPKQVMRAARANGRNFCFLTDKDIDLLLEYGVACCDVPGRFLGLPGQEIMCHELHMNVLNVDRKIPNPESNDLSKINPDIEVKISNWLNAYKVIKAVRPCTIVHNHPVHVPRSQRMPYFRSWWVSDCYRDFRLVENFDYTGWFDRLNRGRELFGAWTGDGHDCSLMYPGKEGVCVYTGDELSAGSIINALENGRFISLRAPGVFLDIKVGDTMAGGTFRRRSAAASAASAATAAAAAGAVKAEISAMSTCPIDVIELISNGKVASVLKVADGTISASVTVDVPGDSMWVIARIKLIGSAWDAASHNFTPLMDAGYDAFTNPIFIR